MNLLLDIEDSPQRDGNSANLPPPPAHQLPRGQAGSPLRGGRDAGIGGEVGHHHNDVCGGDDNQADGGAVEPQLGRGRGRGVGQCMGGGRGESRRGQQGLGCGRWRGRGQGRRRGFWSQRGW
uniref:Uncharacterized protein n=1 Tax=Amphimedon queenslandica TaxID=400682 RepID=A0A1X7VHA2_AMPQE